MRTVLTIYFQHLLHIWGAETISLTMLAVRIDSVEMHSNKNVLFNTRLESF